ncbi:hypothetical protein HY404_04040 [Candidatus Microgenomates bacterium]|nr:hypothetical protein [Candidatus Microgenomates bacterium]
MPVTITERPRKYKEKEGVGVASNIIHGDLASYASSLDSMIRFNKIFTMMTEFNTQQLDNYGINTPNGLVEEVMLIHEWTGNFEARKKGNPFPFNIDLYGACTFGEFRRRLTLAMECMGKYSDKKGRQLNLTETRMALQEDYYDFVHQIVNRKEKIKIDKREK